MIITIIGAGEVGSSIASVLLSRFNEITLNLVDTDLSHAGRVLDLQHAAMSRNNIVVFNSHDLSGTSDILLFCAGKRNPHNATRSSVVADNKARATKIFNSLEVDDKTRVIVMSNPLEALSQTIKSLIPNNVVVGAGTVLDTLRMKFLLAREFSVHPMLVNTLVVGEHGTKMTPLFSSSTISGSSIENQLSNERKKVLTDELINSANTIRDTEPATKYGVAQAAFMIVNALVKMDGRMLTVSIPIPPYYSQLLEVNGIYLSVPVIFEKGKLLPRPIESMNSKEIEMLTSAARSVKNLS